MGQKSIKGPKVISKEERMSLLRDRMKERRAVLGITQEELAEKTGINVRSIRTYEGKGGKFPTGETLLLLAEHLDCDVAYLLGEVNVPAIIGNETAAAAGMTIVEARKLLNILSSKGRKVFMYLLGESGFYKALSYFEDYARARANPYKAEKATNGERVYAHDMYQYLAADTLMDLVKRYGDEVENHGNKEG